MASGLGYNGGPSKCFEYWQTFQNCYMVAVREGDISPCGPLAEDYMECLHGRKEYARQKRIADEYAKQAAKAAQEDSKKGEALTRSPGVAAGLGIIKGDHA
ncbi:hypothetical protein DL96DRAFT_1463138 [Flagelloscypha sp. PMI_526]|nr:hypothetical protein DL96DRAFT_1463138 [Flagelloscypha sp. PMI_526]